MKKATYISIIAVITVFIVAGCKQQSKEGMPNHKLDGLKAIIGEKMKKHDLKGSSMAVFNNYQIVWTAQWGVKASGAPDKIDRSTAFSAASISKPITAIICAILEEKGLIDLEAPISKYLKSWQLPESPFTENGEVNWIHLLSHTAGTNQGTFADFYKDDTIPTIVQSLKGELLPRYDKEIGFLFKPGTYWEYSGGGYVIVQLALQDHFGKSLAELAKEHLFDPLRLQNTTMFQPNEKGFLTNVSKVHNNKGKVIKTGLPITPQVAASGMWSTPIELSKIAIEMQMALRNRGNSVISNSVAKRVTEIKTLKRSGGWGIGWQRGLGFGNIDWFSHSGSNTGVGGELLGTMENGNGYAILANGERQNRFPVNTFIRPEILKAMNWHHPMHKNSVKPVPKDLVDALTSMTYSDFLYGEKLETKIIEQDDTLFLETPIFKYFLDLDRSEMYYLGNNTFKIDHYPNYILFNINSANKPIGLSIFRNPSGEDKVEIEF